VDRLDYTKGLPYKLDGFRAALVRYPELRQKISLIQVVVPSRADIAPYHELKSQIDRLVGEINGEFTVSGWVPIHYIFRHLDQAELLALYRAAEIALVTPLEDGMNLVAKEFCAASLDEDSVLILSEFCGAAVQMKHGAMLVNPYDRDGIADAIYHAYHMPKEERRVRMHRLRRSVQEQDIFSWVDSFLRAGHAEEPEPSGKYDEGFAYDAAALD
jgi:trehalose 6-phosphate synthase